MFKSKEQILLELTYPHYTHNLSSSRFKTFFKIINPINIQKNNIFDINELYKIDCQKISKGEDRRSSLYISNLPQFMTKSKLVKLLNDVGNINFVFIPYDKDTQLCLGYAYINMINYKNVVNVYQKINGLVLSNDGNNKPIQVSYSKFQGKMELSLMFGGKKI